MALKTEEPVLATVNAQESWSLGKLLTHDFANTRNRPFWGAALVCTSLFGLLFWKNLWHFYYAWTTDENYSHGFLVPLISVYFASQVAREGPVPIRAAHG